MGLSETKLENKKKTPRKIMHGRILVIKMKANVEEDKKMNERKIKTDVEKGEKEREGWPKGISPLSLS